MRWIRALAAHMPATVIAVLALLVLGVSVSGVRADESHGARRLLVRLDEEHVEALAAWVAARGGRVVDVETLETVAAPSLGASPAPKPAATEMYPLPSAARIYRTIVTSLQALEPAARPLRVVQFTMTRHRAKLTLRVPSGDSFRTIHKAVEEALAKPFGARVHLGAHAAEPDGSYTGDIEIHLASPEAVPVPADLASVTSAQKVLRNMDALAQAAGLQLQRASAERMDGAEGSPFAIISRDFTFAPAEPDKILSFLRTLESLEGDIVVTELHARVDVQTSPADQRMKQWSVRLAATVSPR